MTRGAALRLIVLSWLLISASGCCAIQRDAAGYQRSCVPNPFRLGRLGPPLEHLTAGGERPAAVWEARLGAYRVEGRSCHWIRLGTYYRLQEGEWQAATGIEGPWAKIDESELPGALSEVAECRPTEGSTPTTSQSG